MPNFNLENYETVEDRLKTFWKDNPDGRIWTEVVHITDDGTCVTVKALVYLNATDTNPVSSGIAQETKGQGGFANKDAWVENCETSAIGRALANWKYQGSNKARPSREEMSKVGNQDNVIVEKKRVPRTTKAEKEAMNKVVDEMVAEPKTKNVANQLKTIMSSMVEDEETMKKYQRESYVKCVSEHKLPEEVESWTTEQMNVFVDIFESMAKGSADNIKEVFEVNDITEGGEEDVSWQENPATEKQMKWVNDILQKATDNGIEGLDDLKAMYGDGNITGQTASQIIEKFNDKVK
jgi:hypothetical protein